MSHSPRRHDVARRIRDMSCRYQSAPPVVPDRGTVGSTGGDDGRGDPRRDGPADDDRWRRLFGMPLWSHPADAADRSSMRSRTPVRPGCRRSFDWMTWYSPGRYPGGEGLASAPSRIRPDARVVSPR